MVSKVEPQILSPEIWKQTYEMHNVYVRQRMQKIQVPNTVWSYWDEWDIAKVSRNSTSEVADGNAGDQATSTADGNSGDETNATFTVDFLDFNVVDGWKPLCKFLEDIDIVDCPTDIPFPHENRAHTNNENRAHTNNENKAHTKSLSHDSRAAAEDVNVTSSVNVIESFSERINSSVSNVNAMRIPKARNVNATNIVNVPSTSTR